MLIEADLHCHSLASSHAYSTVNEMAAAAAKKGLKGFALTDHAPEMWDAPHIWHFHNLVILPRKISGAVVFRGAEANVNSFEGTLDMTEDDLRALEWVVASFHIQVIKPGSLEENTKAYIKTIENNKWIDAIGHCTTNRYPVDFEPIVKKCAECGKFVEINESSIIYKKGSRENSYTILKLCKKYGVQVVVNTDSHYCDLIGETSNAQQIISELDFPKKLIFNSDFDRVCEYISKRRNIDLKI